MEMRKLRVFRLRVSAHQAKEAKAEARALCLWEELQGDQRGEVKMAASVGKKTE